MKTEWVEMETPRTEAERTALEAVYGKVIPLEDIRLCNRSIKEGDNVADAVLVDNKGFLVSQKAKKERMPFQPPSPEFRALYDEGYRLAHTSFDNPEGPKTVVHYWVDPNTGEVAAAKIKRNG